MRSGWCGAPSPGRPLRSWGRPGRSAAAGALLLLLAGLVLSLASAPAAGGTSFSLAGLARRSAARAGPAGGRPALAQPPAPEGAAGASEGRRGGQSWASVCACGLAALLLASTAAPWAEARDGKVAPPVCVSIVDAATNCPPRSPQGMPLAEARLKQAREMLAAKLAAPPPPPASAAAPARVGDSVGPAGLERAPVQNPEADMVKYFEDEQERMLMNRRFLGDLRAQLLPGSSPATGSREGPPILSADKPRLVHRLAIEAADVAKEVTFWTEAVGMQEYGQLPGGGAVVAYGPSGLTGDEGAYFSIEIRPKTTPATPSASGTTVEGAQLSYVQIATPSLIRISRVVGSGGQLVDGYGYWDMRSPAGVRIRGYVEDRRDPVEFVAFTARKGPGMAAAGKALEALGLTPQGPYQKVSPQMQEYMPDLPEGNVLYRNGDPQRNVQVVVVPLVEEQAPSFFDSLPTGVGAVLNSQGKPEFDVMEKPDVIPTPLSDTPSRLTVLSPAGAAGAAGAAGGGDNGTAASVLSFRRL